MRVIRLFGALAFLFCALSGTASAAAALATAGFNSPVPVGRLVAVGSISFVAGTLSVVLSIVFGDGRWLLGRKLLLAGMTALWAICSVVAARVAGSPATWFAVVASLSTLSAVLLSNLAQGAVALRHLIQPYQRNASAFYALDRLGLPKRARRLNARDAHTLAVLPAEDLASAPAMTEYVRRDRDDDLRGALRQRHPFIVVSGPAVSGKSRAAFEAVRAARPRDYVIAPANESAMTSIVTRSETVPRNSVVWIGPREANMLTATVMARLNQRGVTVLVTSRDDRSGLDTDTLYERLMFHPAEFRFAVHLSPSESRAASEAATRDPRVQQALRHVDVGLARFVSKADRLLDAWQQRAREHPRPHSVLLVQAVIDCRRVGYEGPVSDTMVTAVLAAYGQHAEAGLSAGDLADALAPVVSLHAADTAGLSLLLAVPGGFSVPTILIGHPLNEYAQVPDLVWDIVIDLATPNEAVGIGDAALHAGRAAAAITAYRKAAEAGNVYGIHLVARDAVDRGDLEAAEALYLRGADQGDPLAAYRLVEILDNEGRTRDASKAIRRYVQLQPGDQTTALRGLANPTIAKPLRLRPYARWKVWFTGVLASAWIPSPFDYDFVPIAGWIDDCFIGLRAGAVLLGYLEAKALVPRYVLWRRANATTPHDLRLLLEPVVLPGKKGLLARIRRVRHRRREDRTE